MEKELFTIMIVEDEGLVAKDLEARLQQAGYNVAGIADNFDDAMDLFKKKLPDLVLLDITIKGEKDGIDIAEEINKISPTPFIFITAHTDADTLEKAKNTFPASFLIKPFTTSHVLISIELALHNFAYKKTVSNSDPFGVIDAEDDIYLKQDYIFIKDGHRFIKLNQSDVLYMESEDNYVRIFLNAKSYLVRCTLKKAIEKMKRKNYVRVHRSYCVNLNHIDSFTENEIMIKQVPIPIGRNYKEDFIKMFELK